MSQHLLYYFSGTDTNTVSGLCNFNEVISMQSLVAVFFASEITTSSYELWKLWNNHQTFHSV